MLYEFFGKCNIHISKLKCRFNKLYKRSNTANAVNYYRNIFLINNVLGFKVTWSSRKRNIDKFPIRENWCTFSNKILQHLFYDSLGIHHTNSTIFYREKWNLWNFIRVKYFLNFPFHLNFSLLHSWRKQRNFCLPRTFCLCLAFFLCCRLADFSRTSNCLSCKRINFTGLLWTDLDPKEIKTCLLSSNHF